MTRSGLIVAVLCATACGDPTRDAPVVCSTERPAARGVALHAVDRTHGLQCGATLDFTPVNSYQGEHAGVHDREDAVVLINGTCTGTWVAAGAGPVVLTAGHCVGLGDRAVLSFNFEEAPDGDELITEGVVFEQRAAPDYALIRLDVSPSITPTELTTVPGDLLAIIQHPRGRTKVVAEGPFLDACDGQLHYLDLDTLVGSSGAGVLTRTGYLVGVHTDGDCTTTGGGSNRGSTAAAIVNASPYLEPSDIAER